MLKFQVILLCSFGDGCKNMLLPFFFLEFDWDFSPIFDLKLQEMFVELRGKVATLLNEVLVLVGQSKQPQTLNSWLLRRVPGAGSDHR